MSEIEIETYLKNLRPAPMKQAEYDKLSFEDKRERRYEESRYRDAVEALKG